MEPTLGTGKLQAAAAWQSARQDFFSSGDPAPVLAALTAATDAIVRAAFAAALPAQPPATLLAVGSYARGLTFPFSSADLLLLCLSDAELEALKPLLPDFMQRLWDHGLQLNCTARTVAAALDPRAPNLDVVISLLDRRLLAGEPHRLQKLDQDLPGVLHRQSARLRQELAQAARSRHARYQHTPHLLVPDVKKGPGGLMDLRLIRLLGQLGPEREAGVDLEPAARFFAMVRCYLHFSAQKNQNLVDAAAQSVLAQPPFSSRGAHADAVAWMRGYYRQARQVLSVVRPALDAAERLSGSLIAAYHERRAYLSNSEFTVARDRLLLRHPTQLANDPERVIRLLNFVARHGVALASDTAWRLTAARAVLQQHLSQPGARWQVLEELLPLPHADGALRALEEAGLLPVLLPAWEDIEGLPLQIPELRFTADEHTLRCLEELERLRGPVTLASDPLRHRFALLLGDCDRPADLVAALLLHAMPPEVQSRALAALQPPEEARAGIQYLLEHQPELAAIMTARDLGDPEAARALAAAAGTIEQLKLLVLLTYAGLAASSVESLASWRLEQLWLAYGVARDALTRGLETDRIQEVPPTLPGRPEFFRGFPARYLRVHTRAELEMHAQLDAASQAEGVAARLDPTLAGYRIAVIAPDRPGLFASFAGALASFGMNILKAEAFANSSGVVLDTFLFADPNRMLQQNPSEGERLTDMFRRVGLGRTDARRLMRGVAPTAPASIRRSRAQVRFDDDHTGAATLVEVTADDRPGLLYSLASTLSDAGCDIHVVLIDTKGQRAQDVFYVAHEGQPLTPEAKADLMEKLLSAC